MSDVRQLLERYLESGQYGVLKYQHTMPGSVRALVFRMDGEPIDNRERFWVTLFDPDDQQYVWEKMQNQ